MALLWIIPIGYLIMAQKYDCSCDAKWEAAAFTMSSSIRNIFLRGNMEIIGYIGAVLTTAAFLPQALRVIQTKQTRDISRNMYILLTVGICFWLVYGFMKNSVPILLANSVTLIFSVMILFYKLKEEK